VPCATERALGSLRVEGVNAAELLVFDLVLSE
jgi:hypothetical protein